MLTVREKTLHCVPFTVPSDTPSMVTARFSVEKSRSPYSVRLRVASELTPESTVRVTLRVLGPLTVEYRGPKLVLKATADTANAASTSSAAPAARVVLMDSPSAH